MDKIMNKFTDGKYKIRSFIRSHAFRVRYSMRRVYAKMLYHLNGGYPCSSCGVILPIHYSEIRGKIHGRSMAISSSGDILCKHCLMEKIQLYFSQAPILADDEFFWSNGVRLDAECAVTGKIVPTVRTISKFQNPAAQRIGIDVRFCLEWWNGFDISQRVIEEFLMDPNSQYHTSYVVSHNGVLYMRDLNGVEMRLCDV